MLFVDGDGAVVVDGVAASVADGGIPCSGRYGCCTSSRSVAEGDVLSMVAVLAVAHTTLDGELSR